MISRIFIIPLALCTLCLIGCAAADLVPYTFAEKHLYNKGYLADPKSTCDLGYQKIYYVLNNKTEVGGNAVLTFSNCLTADHVEKLKVLATAPDQYSSGASSAESEQAKGEVVKIIKEFRTPLPILSAH